MTEIEAMTIKILVNRAIDSLETNHIIDCYKTLNEINAYITVMEKK